jgi:hypothetical protein
MFYFKMWFLLVMYLTIHTKIRIMICKIVLLIHNLITLFMLSCKLKLYDEILLYHILKQLKTLSTH